MKIHNKLFLYI